ncbi:glycosyltransferase family 2 protein [Candidatus Woesearchaeota archaeon]|jgi:glycosyltransferase involved in cell wall biosynthesis|nr:glycosyltransferase family 2 protein [Candidatus Woesearchaeota archaeon]
MKNVKTPKISVIIPTYNEEDNVYKCIETMLNQTYSNFELIIVDDGSTDKTVEIVKSFKKVKLFEQKHEGPGIARNLGTKHSQGEILIFVDADMEFPKCYVSQLVQPILKNISWGTIHGLEKIANSNNLWAKCWGPVITLDKSGKGSIYRAITKEKFLEYGMFDPSDGYADDQSIMKKSGVKSESSDAWCYHNNPDSAREVFLQSKWIGNSYNLFSGGTQLFKLVLLIILYPLIYLLVLNKMLKIIIREKNIKYLFYSGIFSLVLYHGRFVGMIERVVGGKKVK